MSEALSIPSLKKLFRFPFEDPNWLSRILVGSALTLAGYIIPILPTLIVSGYALRVMRQTLDGQEPTLPEWDDWGGLLKDGLHAMLVGLVYLMPALIVMGAGMALYWAGSIYLPFAATTSSDPGEAMAGWTLYMFVSMAIMFISMFVGTLFSLLGTIAVPVALSHSIAQDDLMAAFRVRQWWRIMTADKLGYFVTWVVVAGFGAVFYAGFALVYSTMILCCLIPFLMAPFSVLLLLIGSALFGQTYRESSAIWSARQPVTEAPPAFEAADAG
jgi:hypothetical protein